MNMTHPSQTGTDRVAVLASKADARASKALGFDATPVSDWLAALRRGERVEVGWRECCGTTHPTAKVRREWLRVVKALRKGGATVAEEPVKHKNGYATNNGGFWNSVIYSMPAALCDCGKIEHGRHHSACPALAPFRTP